MARNIIALNSGGSSVKGIGCGYTAAASPRRFIVTDFLFGSSASPADNELTFQIQEMTAVPTGSTRVATANDQGDSLASTIIWKDTITVDATLTAGAFNLNIGMNQRASFRHVPAPYDEIIAPATSSNGFSFQLSAANTTTCAITVHYLEN